MNSKEKLYYLVEHYLSGDYTTDNFCDQFTLIYSLEVENDRLTKVEKKGFKDIWYIASRFSPYEEDQAIPNAFATEEEVKNIVIRVLKELKTDK